MIESENTGGSHYVGYAGILRDEGVSATSLRRSKNFGTPIRRRTRPWRRRVPDPRYLYYGKDIWEEAITAILCGENLLLVGPKATGKNVLRKTWPPCSPPQLDVSFNINTDAATLLGTDTFENGAVQLPEGPHLPVCGDRRLRRVG